MSGQLKEVRTRIASVKSTQQITKAMKMVSAAKLRRAQDAVIRMRPYSLKMSNILSNIVDASEGDVSIPLAEAREINKVLVVAITSDRGLCGGFNSNIVKAIRQHIADNYADLDAGGKLDIMTVGKKAADAYKRDDRNVVGDYSFLFGNLNFESVAEAAEWIKQSFLNKTYDRIDVVYNSFKNAATQIVMVDQFLPIAKPKAAEVKSDKKDEKEMNADFIFEPNEATILELLVPKILNTQFYRYLLDSNAAEHGARMTAMDKATENASDMLRDLKISYNRARQAAITTELTEIVSGAAALSES